MVQSTAVRIIVFAFPKCTEKPSLASRVTKISVFVCLFVYKKGQMLFLNAYVQCRPQQQIKNTPYVEEAKYAIYLTPVA